MSKVNCCLFNEWSRMMVSLQSHRICIHSPWFIGAVVEGRASFAAAAIISSVLIATTTSADGWRWMDAMNGIVRSLDNCVCPWWCDEWWASEQKGTQNIYTNSSILHSIAISGGGGCWWWRSIWFFIVTIALSTYSPPLKDLWELIRVSAQCTGTMIVQLDERSPRLEWHHRD